jgi:zinc protease
VTGFEKVRRFGFTSSELERTKNQYIRNYEAYYDDRGKITNNDWAEQLAEHFLKAMPVPEISWEVEFSKKTIESITLEEVNNVANDFSNINNSALSLSGPDKGGVNYPTKDELLDIYDRVTNSEVEAYEDDVDDAPLVKDKLKNVKVVSKEGLSVAGATKYALKNGAKVIIYPTEFSKDEVLFTATSFGGSSLLPREDLESAEMVGTLAELSGVGDFDAVQLKKKLAGKIAKLNLDLGTYSEQLQGSASPKNLETLLQLIYLSFEHPRFDKDAFDSKVDMLRNYVVNLEADNGRAFRDTVGEMTTDHHPRNILFNEAFVEKISFDKAKSIYLDRFQDASDFTFIFVGNINAGKDQANIFKYIGNISSNKRTETWKDNHVRTADGYVENIFEREMQVEKSTVFYGLYNDLPYNLQNRIYVRAIADLLGKRYLETIREKEGGSYGVSVRPSIRKRPYEHYALNISFDCDPEKQAELYDIVQDEIEKLVNEGVDSNDLVEVKENYINSREEQSKQNNFWLSVLKNSEINNEPVASNEAYEAMVKGIKGEELQDFAREMFKNPDTVKVVMLPKEGE